MGLVSGIKSIMSRARKLVEDTDRVTSFAPADDQIVRQIGRCDYITLDLQETVFLADDVSEFTQDVELDTVFICGGYAAFLAGYTTKYGDVDFFCTSKFTYDKLAAKLELREDKSPTVALGNFKGTTFNVVHCPDAISMESILDSFDMTWCRVGIDLQDRCIVAHPDADSELPIFDTDRMIARNTSKNNLTDRLFDRYCKYKDRRAKPCPITNDGQVHSILTRAVRKPPEPTPTQIPVKVFDNSY